MKYEFQKRGKGRLLEQGFLLGLIRYSTVEVTFLLHILDLSGGDICDNAVLSGTQYLTFFDSNVDSTVIQIYFYFRVLAGIQRPCSGHYEKKNKVSTQHHNIIHYLLIMISRS